MLFLVALNETTSPRVGSLFSQVCFVKRLVITIRTQIMRKIYKATKKW